MIIHYYNIDNLYLASGTADFQIVLYEKDNSIKFNYRNGVAAPGNYTFVGIENSTGSTGLSYRGLSTTQSNLKLTVLFSLGTPGTPAPDNDGDGYTVDEGDCNDSDASINPGVAEICGDGIDNNCNGETDEGCVVSSDPDQDGDGYTEAQGDCNDNDAGIYPGAVELCNDGKDNNCNGEIDEDCDLITLYFPLLSGSSQETCLGLVNNSDSLNLSGSLKAYDSDGKVIDVKEDIELEPLACREFVLSQAFAGVGEDIAYVTFAAAAGAMGSGYCRLADERAGSTAAYPAVSSRESGKELYVPTITYGSGWSTEIGFVNISSLKPKAEIVFNNGAAMVIDLMMQPNGQHKVVINENTPVTYKGGNYPLGKLPPGVPPVTAATVKLTNQFTFTTPPEAVGVVLYRDEEQMGSAVLRSVSDIELSVPYLVMNELWWSSLAFYNPASSLRTSADDCLLQISAYGGDELRLIEGDPEVPALGTLEATTIIANDEFSPETYGLKVKNECGFVGLEFVGMSDGKENAMGCLAVSGQSYKSGVFARVQIVDNNIWSGIVLLNPGAEESEVTLTAYDENGMLQGEAATHQIEPFGQLAGLPEDLFETDISQASNIRYAADHGLVGLVINNRSFDLDGSLKSQLDILPALPIEPAGSTD